jgi:hypothetical protein
MSSNNEPGILETLRRLGVAVKLFAADRLRLEPASKIPTELVAEIREAKAAILEALRSRPATEQPAIAKTEPRCEEPQPVQEELCWHCGGTNRCTCIACFENKGACVACVGRAKKGLKRWVH